MKTVQRKIRSSREVNQVTEQIKTRQIQCAEKRDSPGADIDRIDHKMQRSLKLPQYTNTTIQKVQQVTEVSQQQYVDMNVDVPAEIQKPEYRRTSEHREGCTDAKTGADDPEMPSGIHSNVQNMLMPGSSEAAVQSPGPVLQTSSRRQTSLCSRQVQCCRSGADELEMRERERKTEREKEREREGEGERERE